MTVKGHGPRRAVAFSPDGSRIVSAGSDGTVLLLDSATGEVALSFPAYQSEVVCAQFSPDGTRIVSAGYGQTGIYDMSVPSFLQPVEVYSAVIPIFVCPSVSEDNPFVARGPRRWLRGRTDYVFSRGANDSWCFVTSGRRRPGGGIFGYNLLTKMRDITDGSSNTIAMGEGAGGDRWPLCRGLGCATPVSNAFGTQVATQPWIIPHIGGPTLLARNRLISSIWGSTAERMNKNPVTDTYIQAPLDDCRPSYEGGPHTTANFRSDHPGGVNFLVADGSVHFLQESINMPLYRQISSINEGAPASIP